MKYRIFSDGGSRGNPGPAAAACVIERLSDDNQWQQLAKLQRYLGRTTNNQAEYQAVLLGLNYLKSHKAKLKPSQITISLDSELVAKQLNGEYRVKHPELKPLVWQVRKLMLQLGNVHFDHVSRAQNTLADRLVNQELNQHQ